MILIFMPDDFDSDFFKRVVFARSSGNESLADLLGWVVTNVDRFRDSGDVETADRLDEVYESILRLVAHANGIVRCIEWNSDPSSAISNYLMYRGNKIHMFMNILKDDDIHD